MTVIEVTQVKRHSKKIATIYFKPKLRSFPGQFVMVNVFDLEEIPLSLSSDCSITVKAVGETTNALIRTKKKFKLGIRGPFGRPFTPANSALLIAGGIGIAPMRYLYHYLKNNKVKLIYGARSSDEVIFTDEFEDVLYLTEDGSFGRRGDVIDGLKMIDLTEYGKIYACGSENMLKSIYKFIKEIAPKKIKDLEFSLERYIKCGIGVCGSCILNKGLRVCTDGPVFKATELDW